MRYTVLLLAAIAAVIAACGGSGPGGGEPSPTVSASPSSLPPPPPPTPSASPSPPPTVPIPFLSDYRSPTPGAVAPPGAWSDCPAVVSADLEEGLHVLDAESCGLTRIAEAPDAYGMSWSPDGVYLAFLRLQGLVQPVNAPGAESDLFLVRADGSQAFQLTDSPGIRETSPVWSPDGSKLAYGVVPASDPNGGHDLIIHTIGNGSTAKIAHDFPCLQSYIWVPSGDQVILSAGCGFDEQYVTLLDLDSGETSVIPGVQSVLAVHPYGDLVAFSCDLNDPEILERRGLCIGRLDGSELSSPVTLAAFPSFGTGSSARHDPIIAYAAVWIRGGFQLAILSSTQRGLFLLPAGGGPGSTVEDWVYSSLYWVTDNVVVASSCRFSGVVPCGPYVLTSYRLDTNESWEALIFNCGSAGGVWSPDGSQLAISTAQLAGCL